MKSITLTQPWASLIAIGAKRIETRSWPTNYRGPLAIHAAAGLAHVGGKRAFWQLEQSQPFYAVLRAANLPDYDRFAEGYPFGAIVAVCALVDCRPTAGPQGEHGTSSKYAAWVHGLSDQERAFGDFSPGRFGWLLDDVRALPEPIPARGALQLWEWTPPEGFAL